MGKYLYAFLFTGMWLSAVARPVKTDSSDIYAFAGSNRISGLPFRPLASDYSRFLGHRFYAERDTIDLQKKPAPRKKLDYVLVPAGIFLSGSYDTKNLQWLFKENTFNRYEWLRVALGVQNNLNKNPAWRFYGNVGYGTKDGEFKYSGSVAYHLTRDRINRVEVYYKTDIERPGKTVFLKHNAMIPSENPLLIGNRDFLLDRYKRQGAALYFRPLPWSQVQLFIQNEERNPRQYTLPTGFPNPVNTHQAGLNFRFARKEVSARNELSENILDRAYPIVRIQVIKGFPGFGEHAAANFWKTSFDLTQRILKGGAGATYLFVGGGRIVGDIPFSYLFNNLAVPPRIFGKNGMGDFQSMDITDYAYDTYATVALHHDFGKVFRSLDKAWFQPELAVGDRSAWSSLAQDMITVNDRKVSGFGSGYYESTVTFKNVIRIKLGGNYIGFGGTFIYGFEAGNSTAPVIRFAPVISPPVL